MKTWLRRSPETLCFGTATLLFLSGAIFDSLLYPRAAIVPLIAGLVIFVVRG